nr:MAG TPA: hypothetical protein [Caudoviricetes sp.]
MRLYPKKYPKIFPLLIARNTTYCTLLYRGNTTYCGLRPNTGNGIGFESHHLHQKFGVKR